MIELRSELPTGGDSASAYIPWLVAIMVFLGILAVSGVNVFDSILSGWSRSITGTLTVQVPPLSAETDPAAEAARTDRALDALSKLPAVADATVLSRSEVDSLLAPWLGDDIGESNIPLPALIDVTLADDSTDGLNTVRDAVIGVVPDAVIDDHRRWFEHLIELTQGFRLLAVCVAIVVTAALALTVVYATRASLAEFHDVITVFHFIGAQDRYVAGQFAKRTFVAALKGSGGGLIAAALVLGAISVLAQNVESGFLPEVSLGIGFWLSLPLIAALAALLAMATAFFTVLGTLRTLM